MQQTIVVKIGTESLEDFEYSYKVNKLIGDITQSIRDGIRVILVSSGAVGFGRKTLWVEKHPQEHKPSLAAIGWDVLMSSYRQKFSENSIHVAGFLVTHADIADKSDRRKMIQESIHACLDQGILPIINENDPLSIEEIDALGRGGDNDQNALLIAQCFQAQDLVLITNTNGVYENPNDISSRIAEIHSQDLSDDMITHLCAGKSNTGTGWMASKLMVGREAGKSDIRVHICNGIESWLSDRCSGGTTIYPL